MAFTIENGVLIKYIAEEGVTDVIIPDGIKVIDSTAFRESEITSVFIPDSVKEIKSCAFADCRQLVSVRLSEQLEKLDILAFQSCSKLSKIVIPESVKIININAFEGCENLTDITLPSDIEYCPACAFEDTPWYERYMQENEFLIIGHLLVSWAPKSETVIIPDGITEIDEEHEFPDTIRKIVFPVGVKVIPAGLFMECEKLEEVVLPDGLIEIGSDAFNRCYNLRSINFPVGLKTIEEYAFRNCRSLKEIILPDSVTDVGNYAFSDCVSVKKLKLPNNNIGWYDSSFNMLPIEHLHIPEKMTDGEPISMAFSSNQLTEITVDENNPSLTSYEGVLYSKDMTVLYKAPDKIEHIEIPDTVTKIMKFAFACCEKLREVVIPESVKEIGSRAFVLCKGLKSIDLPQGLTSIGAAAFAKCISLKKIVIPSSLDEIGENAFTRCENLCEVSMPELIPNLQYEFTKHELTDYYSEKTESSEQLAKVVFSGTPWLKAQGYADDEKEE